MGERHFISAGPQKDMLRIKDSLEAGDNKNPLEVLIIKWYVEAKS